MKFLKRQVKNVKYSHTNGFDFRMDYCDVSGEAVLTVLY